MSEWNYDRLSFQDNTFLAVETANSHMHVSGVATFEIGSLALPEGGLDIDRLRSYVASRLHLIPRYRQLIRHIPIERHPVWVDDHDFNLHYHVRHTCLPRPGNMAQLRELAARIMAQKLDRAKPLWEMWIIEGLEGGEAFATITKVHHCMIDGLSGVELMQVLMSIEPNTEIQQPLPWRPREQPSDFDLVRDAAMRWVGGPLWLAANAGEVIRSGLDENSELRTRLRALGEAMQTGVGAVADTPLNGRIGPHRRFAWTTMQVADVKRVKKALGGTLNDVVLTMVTGAIRRYLDRHGTELDEREFVVAAPVSVRSEAERGELGNRVSAWLIPLPLAVNDPRERLAQIQAKTAELKESGSALGADTLMDVGEWTPSTLFSLAARVVPRLLPMNMIVTNVPGPQFPLYMLDAKLLEQYGQVPLMDGIGLGIALFSYDGKLCWGFNADWDRVADLDSFVEDIRASFDELETLAQGMSPARSA